MSGGAAVPRRCEVVISTEDDDVDSRVLPNGPPAEPSPTTVTVVPSSTPPAVPNLTPSPRRPQVASAAAVPRPASVPETCQQMTTTGTAARADTVDTVRSILSSLASCVTALSEKVMTSTGGVPSSDDDNDDKEKTPSGETPPIDRRVAPHRSAPGHNLRRGLDTVPRMESLTSDLLVWLRRGRDRDDSMAESLGVTLLPELVAQGSSMLSHPRVPVIIQGLSLLEAIARHGAKGAGYRALWQMTATTTSVTENDQCSGHAAVPLPPAARTLGTLKILCAVSRRAPNKTELQVAVCTTLQALAAEPEGARRILSDDEAIPHVLLAMRNHFNSPELQRAACGLLAAIISVLLEPRGEAAADDAVRVGEPTEPKMITPADDAAKQPSSLSSSSRNDDIPYSERRNAAKQPTMVSHHEDPCDRHDPTTTIRSNGANATHSKVSTDTSTTASSVPKAADGGATTASSQAPGDGGEGSQNEDDADKESIDGSHEDHEDDKVSSDVETDERRLWWLSDPAVVNDVFQFISSEDVLGALTAAATVHGTNSEIVAAVLRAFELVVPLAHVDACRDILMDAFADSNLLHVALTAMERHMLNLVVLLSGLTIVAAFAQRGVADISQRRTIVLFVRKVMTRHADPMLLAVCCAVVRATVDGCAAEEEGVVAADAVLRTVGGAAAAAEEDDGDGSSAHPSRHNNSGGGGRRLIVDEKFKFWTAQQIAPIIGTALQHFGELCPPLRVAADAVLRSLVIRRF